MRRFHNVIQLHARAVVSPLPHTAHIDALASVAIAGSVVNGACAVILEQPMVSVPALPSIATHQQASKDHANNWIATIQPLLISSIHAIVSFSNMQNAFLTPLLTAAPNVNIDPTARRTVVQGLTLLKDACEANQKKVKDAVQAIDQFRSDFSADAASFNKDSSDVSSKLIGDNGEIKQLQDKMKSLQDAMNKDNAMIAGGATMIVVGALVIAVGILAEIPTAGASTALVVGGVVVVGAGATLVGVGAKDYKDKMSDYKDTAQTLADDQAEVTLLTHVGGLLTTFETNITAAVTALNSMEAAWQGLDTNFSTLLTDVQQADVDSVFLEAQLQAAAADWDDMATQARKVQDMIEPPKMDISVVTGKAA